MAFHASAARLLLRAGALAPLAMAGCSLLVDTGGFSGGANDPPPATDSGATTVTTDPDGASEDTESDSGLDAAPTGTCRDSFADSFDVGAIGATWDSVQQSLATFSLDTSDVRSPPNALLVSSPDGGFGSTAAKLRKGLSKSKSTCCELALKNSGDGMTVLTLRGMGDNYNLGVAFGSGNCYVSETWYPGASNPGGINRIVGNLPYTSNRWVRLVIRADLPAAAGTGTLAIGVDGVTRLTSKIGSDTYDLSLDSLEIGLIGQSSGPRTLRFDDVGCTVH